MTDQLQGGVQYQQMDQSGMLQGALDGYFGYQPQQPIEQSFQSIEPMVPWETFNVSSPGSSSYYAAQNGLASNNGVQNGSVSPLVANKFNGPLWVNNNNLDVSPTQTVAPVQDVKPSFTYNLPTYNNYSSGSSGGSSRGASGKATPPTPQDYRDIWQGLAQQRFDEAQAAYLNGTGSAQNVAMAEANLRQWNGYNDAAVQNMQFYAGGMTPNINYALSQGYDLGVDPSVIDWFNESPYANNQTMMGYGSPSSPEYDMSVSGVVMGPTNQTSWTGDVGNQGVGGWGTGGPYGTGSAYSGSGPQQYGGGGSGVQYYGGYNGDYQQAIARLTGSSGYNNPYAGDLPGYATPYGYYNGKLWYNGPAVDRSSYNGDFY